MTAAFGDRVIVQAATMRVVGYREDGTGTERYKIPQANDVPWFDPVADVWPGEPVSLETDPARGTRFLLEPQPNGAAVVRYRRLAFTPQMGIVVGNTWRWEGVVAATGLGGTRRSLSLYQVALQPARSGKAIVVFVHPTDLSVLETAAVETVPRGGGRLGGG